MPASQGKKILIVEDEPASLKVLADTFASEGFTVFQATDGVEGLETALKEQPDLILLDIVMRNMDGMTMLKKLREDERGKESKIIVLTNLNDIETTAEALEKGVFDYLVKSNWELGDLVKRVKSKLGVI